MQVVSKDYFDLRRSVPMSREEEHRCALAYVKTKDPALAERLIVANMRMVAALAHHYCRADDDLGDFVQEGNRGLLLAVEKYDPTRGIKFCSYAVWWVRAYMLKLTMSNWRLVKVGTTQAQRKLFFSLGKERDRLQREGGEVNPRALAARLRVKESEVVAMLERFAGGEMSLETPARALDTDGATLGDSLSDASGPRPDRCVEEAEFSRILRSKLEAFGAKLKGREVQIFRQRLFNDEPAKLAELATSFGVTRERVRQLEGRLKVRIRAYLQAELENAFEVPVKREQRHETITLPMANSGMPGLERPIVHQEF
jgi:RNA polymerase sigma-32 factor